MERTQADVILAMLLQRHEVPYHVDNVGAVHNAVNGITIYHTEISNVKVHIYRLRAWKKVQLSIAICPMLIRKVPRSFIKS